MTFDAAHGGRGLAPVGNRCHTEDRWRTGNRWRTGSRWRTGNRGRATDDGVWWWMHDVGEMTHVLVTGGTGFVGGYVVRRLLGAGYTPVCLVRSPEKLRRRLGEVGAGRYVAVVGDVRDRRAVRDAAARCHAVIHLVGIILPRRLKRQTYAGIHVRGTRRIVEAARSAGIDRFVHMSALGTRPDAVASYHKTKWAAETCVRESGLAWTIFRPSVIHGPDGEFMRLMRRFACGVVPPVMPYFGSGEARVQPVFVKDVAACFVASLSRPESVGEVYPLGGPVRYTWKALYETCRSLLPGARRRKRLVGLPAPLARFVAGVTAVPMAVAELLVPRVGLFRFNGDQVTMALEESVCDHRVAEGAFGLRMRAFEDALARYGDQIG